MVRFPASPAKSALLLCLFLVALACQKKGEETLVAGEGEGPSGSGETPDGSAPSHSEGLYSSPLMRLSPEQLSRTLERTIGFTMSWDGGDGRIVDGIVDQFALPLGGIDFENSSVRDPAAKVQTLLVARLIAWRGAEFVVWKDFERLEKGALAELKIFTAPFQPWTEVPGKGDSDQAEKAWTAQLENIYWSLLSRAPSPEEITLHRDSFLLVMKDENAGVAWISSIYALLGSAEFWNLWGPRQAPRESL